MASHEELVAELPKLERLSNAARLKLAKKRRQKQLKKFQDYTRVTRQVSRSERSATSVNFDQDCLLQDAVTRNDSSEAEKVLRTGSNPNDSNADGLTPLHRCCIDNSYEMARILILNGADLNTRDIEGWTPLHAAAACGNLQIINLMVDSGADLVALNHDDKMPVDVGCDADIQYILQQKMLEAGYTDDTCQYIRSSVPKTMLADLKDSIKGGRSLNIQDKYGATALHVAAANGYSEVLDFLLSQEVNVNIQDNEGWTPFHAAVCWGQKEVMQQLSEKGADMEIENIHGETPYAITDEAEIRQLILELKNQQNSRRMPILATKVETDDGALSDRASTPDHEGTPNMGRSRTSSRSLQARRSSTLKKDMVKRYSAKSERLIRQETMDQEDIERTIGGEVIVDNIDNMDPLSPSSINVENESAFTTPLEDSMAKSESLSSSSKADMAEKGKDDAARMQRRQLKSVLKKKGPTPVVTVSQQLDNDYEEEFEISNGRKKRQNTQECCTIS